MGQKLAASLNQLIDGKTSDTLQRSVIEAEIADAAGVEAETIRQILQGEILCPPLERLEGIASALDVDVDSLRVAAESDGCDYSGRGDETAHQVPIREVIPKEQYERLQRVKEELERALDS